MKQSTALTVLKTGANVFLTGEAGSGKTYTINLFKDFLRSKYKTVAVTASTGIAATHINGITIHSFSGLGIKEKIEQKDLDTIASKKHVVDQIQNADVLIIDEISMLSAQVLDNVERIISYIRGGVFDDRAFGGMQVIFVGDFYQLPPVDKKGIAKFAFESDAWKKAKPVTCYLDEQHRQSDPVFTDILNSLRHGTITEEHKRLICANNVSEIPKTKLFTHNRDVDDLNEKELRKMDGDAYIYDMQYNENSWNKFLIETLKKGCLSPETLILKKGALVMFTRNNFKDGETNYVNGTIGTVIDLDGTCITVRTKQGAVIHLTERAKWSIGEDEDEKASISQFPLRLAWAVTIHKSQGMSLDSAVIDLSNCFEYGQGYVALSRVCSLCGLFLEGINPMAFKMHPQVIEQDKLFRISSKEMDEKYNNNENI
jgi:ATP-dependent exoDNAse (exonuclease V) alpha subunit